MKMAKKMSREELLKEAKNMDRAELIEKLNEDAINFIEQLPKRERQDGWSIEDWSKEMQQHPLFMTKPPVEGEEMSPLVEALQSLKYDPDENTPDELARSYKDDGNENFKRKKYRWAVDSYTQGIEAKCTDQELLVQLYSNRAAAQYHIGNYEKALKDASQAKSIKSNHVKAIERGALCCFQLNKLADCIDWCEEGLKKFPENSLLKELNTKASHKKKTDERDKRKALALGSKRLKELEIIKKAIDERKIQLADENFESLANPVCPDTVNSTVHLNEDNKLIWPVMILYPEYGTSDYIQEFHEDSAFLDHFSVMFENETPGWDEEKKYILEKLKIYFMDKEYLIPVKITDILKNVISHKRYKVLNGTPCFFVTASGSAFDNHFRGKYSVCD